MDHQMTRGATGVQGLDSDLRKRVIAGNQIRIRVPEQEPKFLDAQKSHSIGD
jgi:hypothetical protein